MILSLLVEPIKRDLDITDIEFSYLLGAAFALFYTGIGIPVAHMADRYNRIRIIAVGVFLWSLMTAVCGVARNYAVLFLGRMGVGIGESALSPAAYSLIADLFPASRAARALSVYSIGIYVGAGCAFFLGGAIVGLVASMDTIVLPLLGKIRPWQLVFFLLGFPGIILAAIICLLRDPRSTGHHADKVEQASLREFWRFMRSERRFLFCHFAGMALFTLLGYGFLGWAPSVFIREHGWTAPEVGSAFGVVVAVFGSLGLIAGARLSEWFESRGVGEGMMRTLLIGSAGCLAAAVTALFLPPAGKLVAYGALTFANGVPAGVAIAALQVTAPARLRAKIASIYLFFNNLVGLGIGPTAVAFMSTRVIGDESQVSLAIGLVAIVAMVPAILLFRLSYAPFVRARGKAL